MAENHAEPARPPSAKSSKPAARPTPARKRTAAAAEGSDDDDDAPVAISFSAGRYDAEARERQVQGVQQREQSQLALKRQEAAQRHACVVWCVARPATCSQRGGGGQAAQGFNRSPERGGAAAGGVRALVSRHVMLDVWQGACASG